MKQNVMNQTMILENNDNHKRLFTESFWNLWRLTFYKFLSIFKSAIKIIWEIVRGIACLLFVSPPEQELIEQTRVRTLQYKGIF